MKTQKQTKSSDLRVIGARPSRKKKEVKHAAAAPVAPPAPVPAPAAPARHADVRQRAMLVNLSVHEWLANTTDKAITDDVAQQRGIAADMGKYQKNLLSKAALERLRSAGNKIRATHKRYTLPWNEWGTRIVSNAAFMKYRDEVRAAIDEFDQVFRDEFEAMGPSGQSKYDEAKDEARRLLNGAFNEADYPTLDTLRRKFRASIKVMPIPASEDFRVDLSAEVTDQIRQEIEADSKERVSEAMNGVFARLQGVVAKFAAALKADNTDAIRKTLFTGAEAVLEALPLLNITADPALDVFAADIRKLIQGLDAKGLRENETLRQAVSEKADAILAKMNDFLG